MSTLDDKLEEWARLAENTSMRSAVGEYTPYEFDVLIAMLRKCREQRNGNINELDNQLHVAMYDAELLKLAGE